MFPFSRHVALDLWFQNVWSIFQSKCKSKVGWGHENDTCLACRVVNERRDIFSLGVFSCGYGAYRLSFYAEHTLHAVRMGWCCSWCRFCISWACWLFLQYVLCEVMYNECAHERREERWLDLTCFFFLNESDARKQQLKFLEICIFLDMVWRHQQSLYRLWPFRSSITPKGVNPVATAVLSGRYGLAGCSAACSLVGFVPVLWCV